MAGTTTLVSTSLKTPQGKICRIHRVDWVGDAANGSVPDTLISINGFISKVITIPGSPSPTASYNVKLFDPDSATLDVLLGLLAGRSATVSEQVYPAPALGQLPVYACSGREGPGTAQARQYTLNISGNSVNSAKGAVLLYCVEEV